MAPTSHAPGSALALGRRTRSVTVAPGFLRAPEPSTDQGDGAALIEDATESHLLVVAPTGAGKGRSALLPWLLSYRGSAVVVDPKGEAVHVSGRWRREVGQTICIFDPWGVCTVPHARWGPAVSINPLDVLLSDTADLGDDCMTLAELLAGEAPRSSQDPFWRQNALHLMSAVIGWIWIRRVVTGVDRDDDRTIGGVMNMLLADRLDYLIATILDAHSEHKEMSPFVRAGFVSFLSHEAEKVRTSVRSEAVSMLRVFASERVQRATSTTTLPTKGLQSGEVGVTVYLVVPPDRLESHAPLMRVILGTILAIMVRRRARPELPTLFLVDEVGHLGPIPQLKQSITLLRGYGVRVALFIQSIAQLKGLWPADYETILENCSTWLNFGNASVGSAKQVADHLGDIQAEALFGMGRDQLAIHRSGRPTVIARRIDYLVDEMTVGRFDPNPYHSLVALP